MILDVQYEGRNGMRLNRRPFPDSLAQMRRVSDAIVYFRQWPSLKSQQEAIRGLEDLSGTAAKECIDEFNRLMRTVGPAVQFQVG